MMTRGKKGMFAAFLVFKKAYDRVNQSKPCEMGLPGRNCIEM